MPNVFCFMEEEIRDIQTPYSLGKAMLNTSRTKRTSTKGNSREQY